MKRRLLALALLVAALLSLAACGEKEPGSDTAYVQDKGYLTVGVTPVKPMDYQDESGTWMGFDADMARAFAQSLGVDAVFVKVDWRSKHHALDDQEIDVVWNGMTFTEELRQQMSVSAPYCRNAQVVVLPTDIAGYHRTEDSLRSLDFVAEAHSAGAAALNRIGLVCTPMTSQELALAEVARGKAGACVIDQFMATATVGPGRDYPDLSISMELNGRNGEDIVVGFRKDSDLLDAWTQFWADAWEDGTVAQVARTYDMESYLLAP